MSRFSKGTRRGLRLYFKELMDKYIIENFRQVQEYVNSHDILRAHFYHKEFCFNAAGTYTVNHGLFLVPKDLIVTWREGNIGVTIDYDSVDDTSMSVTVTGKGCFRVFFGNVNKFDVR